MLQGNPDGWLVEQVIFIGNNNGNISDHSAGDGSSKS